MNTPFDKNDSAEETSEKLAALIDSPKEEVVDYLHTLSAKETAKALSDLPYQTQTTILTKLPSEQAGRIVESVCSTQAAEILSHLEPETAVEVLRNVESNEYAEILALTPSEVTENILGQMSAEEEQLTRESLAYAPYSAGRLMVREFIAYPSQLLIKDVVRDLREKADLLTDVSVQYVFVLSETDTLVGVLRLRDLVLLSVDRRIEDIMIKNPTSVPANTELEELKDLFSKHRFLGVPVTDNQGKLLGVIRKTDVEEALGERSESDYLKASGILGGEELRTMPVLQRSSRRLSWLSVNILLNVFAASVIALFQDTLQAVIALAVFLPIISDMSGCSGAQAIAVSIRELSLGLLNSKEVFKVIRKEILIGLMNGLVLGLLIATVAWVWKSNVYLGLVVGTALAVNTLLAVLIGGSLPLILKKFNQDPALASGPILTTVTDMCGFMLVLGLATLMLGYLV